MNEDFEVSIATDFSQFPAGRVPEDGDYNGQTFREEILLPKLKEAMAADGVLVISLDGLKSCGSSFLESSFGGLIRYEGIKKSDLKSFLKVEFSEKAKKRFKLAIDEYINNAKAE